jgi:hypothetical protein
MNKTNKLTATQKKNLETLKANGGRMEGERGRCFPRGLNGNTIHALRDLGLVRVECEGFHKTFLLTDAGAAALGG